MSLLAIFLYIINISCGNVNGYNDNDNELHTEYNLTLTNQPSYFDNGRYHELPTVTIQSSFIVAMKSTEWILDISKKRYDPFVNVKVAGSFPFTVFIEDPNFPQWGKSYWYSNRYVKKGDIFNSSTYSFDMSFLIPMSYLRIQNYSLEFRSTIPPFFGISLRYFINETGNIGTYRTSTSISEPFNEYFRLIENKIKNQTCDAYFFLEQNMDLKSGKPQSGILCLFANEMVGVASTKFYYVDQVKISYANNGKNCWRKGESCEQNGQCDLNQPVNNSYQDFSPTMLVVCTPEAMIENQKEISSTPIFGSISDPEQNIISEFYFNKENIKASSMIRMEPYEENQHLGSQIVVTCRTVSAYATNPIHFGIKQKSNDNIRVFPSNEVNNVKADLTYYWEFSVYTIPVDSTDIESIFCFAPVRGSYDWINASKPVYVHEFSPPTFLSSTKYTASMDANVTTIERTFLIGSRNKSISCDATGYPFPSISWTRNNTPVEPTEDKSMPGLIRHSVIIFEEIGHATPGVYICRAQNSQGEAQMLYKVFVTDNSATIFAVSIAIPVIGTLLISSCIILFIWKRMKRRQFKVAFLADQEVQQFMNGWQRKKSLHGPNESILGLPFNPNHIILRSNVKFDVKNILGSGHFGLVLDGWICTDGAALVQAAIKTTKQTADVLHFKALLSEVKISSYLTGHPNIVNFFGACIENIKNGEIYAAYEFCQQGDLLAVLRKRKLQLTQSELESSNDFTGIQTSNNFGETSFTEILFKWSHDISNGMTFLRSKNVIHGDLAARNILLTNKNVAKISDFGLSRQLLNDYSIYQKKTKVPLPWRWMAPESLTDSNFSVHSDMWSFGIILWEIFSFGDPPFPGQKYDAKFIKDVCEGMRLYKPQFASTQIYEIMLRCWEKDPKSRPNIASVAREIQELIGSVEGESETDYTIL